MISTKIQKASFLNGKTRCMIQNQFPIEGFLPNNMESELYFETFRNKLKSLVVSIDIIN